MNTTEQLLKDLKFVRNAVATKDFVPELTFFRICDGRVTGFNGELAISSPVAIDLDIAPSASHFMKALNACDEEISLKLKKEKLEIKSGRFKTIVNCVESSKVPTMVPSGKKVKPSIQLIPCFKKLQPFMGIDASKPWACGVLFRGMSAYVTNNVVLIEYWLGTELPLVNIPATIINEVIKHGAEPDHLLVTDSRITFMYEDGKWISSSLNALEWPAVETVINRPAGIQRPFSEGFFSSVDKLLKFGDELGRCYFKGGLLATHTEHEFEGASAECSEVPDAGCYNLKQLSALAGVAVTADFTQYPQPVPFIGENLRGVIVGYRS